VGWLGEVTEASSQPRVNDGGWAGPEGRVIEEKEDRR
jgi:hypothetical protein